MTADVNVTEKVARAEAERRYAETIVGTDIPTTRTRQDRDAFVAGALWQAERLADPEVLAGMAGVLAAHTGWAQVSGDGGEFRLICHDCGEDLGAERIVVAEWVDRTGKDPAEWNRRGKVPAYDEAQAAHQATALADWLAGGAR